MVALGHEIDASTIRRILRRHGIPPAPKSGRGRDNDILVVSEICVQPFKINHVHEGKARPYTPDIMVLRQLRDGTSRQEIYEVKPRDTLAANWSDYKPRFQAAINHCRQHGARFSIVTEKRVRTPYLVNATFLRRFRETPDKPEITAKLIDTIRSMGPTTTQGLLAATYWDEHTIQAQTFRRVPSSVADVYACIPRPPFSQRLHFKLMRDSYD